MSRKKSHKAKSNALFRERVKELRPFLLAARKIDLRKPPSPSQKSAITRAFKEYTELTSRPYKIYRPKSKDKLSKAQAFARHEKGGPKFDVAFIPVASPKAKIKWSDGKMKVQTGSVTEEYLFFDLVNLAANPEQEIANTLDKNPKAKAFVVMAGKYLWNGAIQRKFVEENVMKLMARYSPGGEKYNENNHYQNWLFGLVASEFTDQKSLNEYRKAYHDAKEVRLKQKKSQRRIRRAKYGKA